MENTRLVHSELCELLKMFTLGYGPLLLGFFVFSYISLLITIYYIINKDSFFSSSENAWELILPLIIHEQIVMFLMSIIIFVSFINEKVTQSANQPTHLHIFFNYAFIYIHILMFYIYLNIMF